MSLKPIVQIYGTKRLFIKNSYLPKVLNEKTFFKRIPEFLKLTKDQFARESSIFMAKEGTDLNRYKGVLKGSWNILGANSKITFDKWNGTLKKAVDQWLSHLNNIQPRQGN